MNSFVFFFFDYLVHFNHNNKFNTGLTEIKNKRASI